MFPSCACLTPSFLNLLAPTSPQPASFLVPRLNTHTCTHALSYLFFGRLEPPAVHNIHLNCLYSTHPPQVISALRVKAGRPPRSPQPAGQAAKGPGPGGARDSLAGGQPSAFQQTGARVLLQGQEDISFKSEQQWAGLVWLIHEFLGLSKRCRGSVQQCATGEKCMGCRGCSPVPVHLTLWHWDRQADMK